MQHSNADLSRHWVRVSQVDPGGLTMALQVVVATVGDAPELVPAEAEAVLEVCAR